MDIPPTDFQLHAELIPALPQQEPVLRNLLELYSHDFSEFVDLKVGPDGRFGYEQLPLYWTDPDRYPFLIRADGHLAGFVFVSRGSHISPDPDIWDLSEFFILRGFRRLGVGTAIARQVWERFPGKWEVRVTDRNRNAQEFWGHAISGFLGKAAESITFEKGGETWRGFSFTSGPLA
jgi:predicted acetyltransferase